MAVSEIKQYRQKDGTDILKVFTKPTKKFPDGGYFYVDAKDIDLVNCYDWFLVIQCNGSAVRASIGASYSRQNFYLHQKLAYKYLSYYPECIDHINLLEIDNIDENLKVVNRQQNRYNSSTRGYEVHPYCFNPVIHINGKSLYLYSGVKTEIEACQLQYKTETKCLRGILKDDYYMYDFLKDRRNDLDILDLERTGVVSAEEATYKHVIRYAKDNAWYYYRYNLKQYFKDNHIPVPNFITDEDGFMRHPVTNKLLCPL